MWPVKTDSSSQCYKQDKYYNLMVYQLKRRYNTFKAVRDLGLVGLFIFTQRIVGYHHEKENLEHYAHSYVRRGGNYGHKRDYSKC